MMLLRACWSLAALSFRRQLWSVQTLMLLAPILGCGLFVMGMNYAGQPTPDFVRRHFERQLKRKIDPEMAQQVAEAAQQVVQGKSTEEEVLAERGQPMALWVQQAAQAAFQRFSQEFVLGLYASFLLPVIALAYATTSLGQDREDRTLLFLLIRPIPRPCVLLAKAAAATPLVLGLAVGSFWVYCRLAGPVGRDAWAAYWPAVVYSALAYIGLFHLFSVLFRHATIIALVYALFMETFIGNMPGIVKRVAVNFYGRSLMLANGELKPPEEWFAPVTADVAQWTLWAIAAGSLALALGVFQIKEYRDLT